jgi:cytoskeleton protein RodZ
MPDTPGSSLKSAREARKLNIAQVAKGTRLRAHYIQAMEDDRFENLPSLVQVRGFLRVYAEYLDLDAADLIRRLEINLKSTQPKDTESKLVDRDEGKVVNIDPGSLDPTPRIAPSLNIAIPEPVKSTSTVNEDDPHQLQTIPADSFPQKPQPQINSKMIFLSIGEQLILQREGLSLSLDEVERQSHVRKHYLESIEAGRFEELPSSVQARGMLSNYARFLEIDLDEILLRYADGLQAQRAEQQPVPSGTPASSNEIQQRMAAVQRYFSIDLFFGGGLILLLVFFAVWGTGKVIDLYKSPNGATNPASISDIILTPVLINTAEGPDTTQPALIITSLPATQVGTAISSVPGSGQVQVYVIVLERTYMRVMVDGKKTFDGRADPGSAFPFNGYSQVEVMTGNGSSLQIVYNQVDLGVMGVFGEVVDRIYTQSEVLEPTGTTTPTPTITLTPTKTLRPTSTAIPSRTPKP